MNKNSISNVSALFVLFATTACIPDVSSVDDAGLLETDTEGATDGADDALPAEDGDGDGATSSADEGGGTSGGGEGGDTGGSDGGDGGSDGGADPVCGDGIVDEGEECDDGGESEACDSDCTAVACGDGVVNEAAGEACDGAGRTESCNDDCTLATCGDGVLNATAGEECDAGGENAECNADCTVASCGDGVTNASAGEACDDMGESASCNADCSAASCGDSIVNETAGEACDDGGETETCNADCSLAICGDGVVNAAAGEACDDGNDIDLDACTNTCALGAVVLAGNAQTDISSALTAMGEAFVTEESQWATPMSGSFLIISRDGGTDAEVDYQAHLDAGGHVLMIGGSNHGPFFTWLNLYVAGTSQGWQTTGGCEFDWNRGPDHPITASLPDSYEFPNQSTSYHVTNFLADQPDDAEVLGTNCDGDPNGILVTRTYPSGGTFTYMAHDLGRYTDGDGLTESEFVVPFLTGYLSYVRN